jgi:AcrR family transcriptional regulator
MVFDSNPMKSAVQRVVEETLALPVTRFDADTRRLRIKAAYILECVEHGYASAKIADVAARAQVSTATIYRDFGDRDVLLLESLEWVIGIFAQNWRVDSVVSDPVERLEALLLTHGQALADPFMGWIFRLYVHLANTAAPHLLVLAKAARDANLAFWQAEIAALEDQGWLVKTNHKITLAILLGAIERRTIFARLAFGENDDREPSLNAIAAHTALSLFKVYGSQAFWADRPDEAAPGWLGDTVATHGLDRRMPAALLDLPSVRLKAFGDRVLSRDVNRLDADGRKVRVQLAAMLECLELGYEAATIASVAARSGVSTATFYNDYRDKRALFLDAIILQSRFRVDYLSLIDRHVAPADAIAAMVYSIAYVLADPDFLWFHRVSMASEISDAPNLIQSSRDTRAHTEGFWFEYLSSLEREGVLSASDQALTMNLLLGATQRRSVLSMIFFGVDDVRIENLSELALASTDFVMRLIGEPAALESLTKSETLLHQPTQLADL